MSKFFLSFQMFPFSHLLETPKLYSWYTQALKGFFLFAYLLFYFFNFIFSLMYCIHFPWYACRFKTLPGGTLRIADFSLLLHVSTNQSVCQLFFFFSPINSFIKFILWCRNVCLFHIDITVFVRVE